MVSFSSLLLACSAAAGILAAPTSNVPAPFSKRETSLTSSATGTSNGFYYSFWTDGTAEATYTNGDAGEYSVSWSGDVGNFVGGKGWETGSAQ